MQTKHEFIIGEIANDFRYRFTTRLSDKAKQNGWTSTNVEVWTNEEQNAFHLTHKPRSNVEMIKGDVECVLNTLKEMFSFEIVSISSDGCEIVNISCARGGQDAI